MNLIQQTQSRAIEANKVKEIVVRTLSNEGYITKEKAEEFLSKYAVVEHHAGWLGATIDKLLRNKTDIYYRIVKILS